MDKQTWFDTIMGEGSPAHEILTRKINYMADDMCRRHMAGLVASDRDDVAQELWLALCKCGEKYNPARGAVTTFCYQQLRSASNLLLRKRLADTRLVNIRTVPVYPNTDEAVKTNAVPEELLMAEPEEKTPYRPSELFAFAERQPEPLRSLLLRCLNGELDSIAAMAREAGIPKTSFVRKYLEPCRRRFAEDFGEVAE